MAQRKETKTTITVRDLKPKKDAKGGVVQNVSTQVNAQTRQQNHHSTNRIGKVGG